MKRTLASVAFAAVLAAVGRVANHFIWYGEDPVRSITLSETSLLGGA